MKTLISSEQFKVMPWKNGLGVTSEISIHPEDADFTQGDFIWRVSSAKVQAGSLFSNFPGYDRWLTVLSGDGLILNDRKLSQGEVFCFHGEEKIDCKLLGSAVEDFGIIFRRDICDFEMQIVSIDKSGEIQFDEGTHFLKPLAGNIICDEMNVKTSDVLRIHGSEKIEINAEKFPVSVLLVKQIK